jgi:multidrug resistance protein, MATE family
MTVLNSKRALPERIDHKAVMGLAWPVVVSMLSYTAMGLVDTLFVGRLGTAPLAAVGLGAIAMHLLQAFPLGLMAGARVVVSQRHGAEDDDGARKGARLAIQVGLLFGGVVAILGSLGAPLLTAMGAEGAVLEHAQGYLTMRALGGPGVLLTWGVGAWFQGRGDTRTPMRATLLANALNVVLDPIFIFGLGPMPALGVEGAALSTSLAFTLNGLMLAAAAARGLRGGRPLRADLAELWRLGSPIGTRYVLDVASFVLFAAVLARVGEAALAAHVVVIRVVSVSFLPGHAIGEAAGVLVGQAVGAGRPALARQAWRSAVTLALGVMGACSLVFLAVPELLLRPFGASAEVLITGVALMRVAAAFQLGDAVAMVGLGVLNGAGDTRFTMRATVACAWLVKLPVGVGLALGLGWGATGAWLGLTVEIMAIALLCVHRIRGARWLGETTEAPAAATVVAAK